MCNYSPANSKMELPHQTTCCFDHTSMNSSLPRPLHSFNPLESNMDTFSVSTHRFTLDLVVLKRSQEDSWEIFTYQEFPVVSYSFSEISNRDELKWSLKLNWPDSNQFIWKGDFCIEIGVFRLDDVNYKKIVSKRSSEFQIYSKPSVYLAQLENKKRIRKSSTDVDTPIPIKMKNNSFYEESLESDLHGDIILDLCLDTDVQKSPKIKLSSNLVSSLGSLEK
jgi:hypothetical protein